MSTENSREGTISNDDAVAQILANATATEETEEVEATDEVEELSEDVDANEDESLEAETMDDDFESDEATDDDATDDEIDDTAEDIDADELNQGYLRQADYTRKTQELAAQRQEFDAEKSQFQAQAQAQLQQLKDAAELYAIPTKAEPDWVELAQTMKPEALKAQKAEWEAEQAKTQEAAEIKRRIDDVTFEQTRQKEAQALLQRIPEWNDAKVQEAEVNEIALVMGEYGISTEEIGAIVDHRQLAIMRDLAIAKRSEKVIAQKSAKPKRKVKAGAAPTKVDPKVKQERELASRLKASGSVNDAAALLMARGRSK